MELSWDLYETPGDELEAFVRHILLPQRDWKEEVQDAWQRICKFLQHQCFEDELVLDQEVRVLKVVKGGSSGKGTTLNQSSDLDVILFLSCFSSFQSQQLLRDGIISFMEDKLERCGRSLAYQVKVASHKGPRPARSLSLQLQSKKSSRVIRMDLLPAFDVLGSLCPDSKPAPDIYEDLINSSSYPGEFSPSFTVIQRHFVKSRPIKLKNLLQLVKFWYLKYLKEKHRKVTLPSKYALELLTIYAWEMGTEESESFDLDTGLVAVMELLRDYKNICIYWTKYYDFQNQTVRNCIKQQLKECRPVILDPADPTNNLGRKRNWDVVAKEATYCLRQACCQTVDHSQRWHVPRARDVQVTVKQTGQETWSISVPPYNPIWRMKAEIKKRNLVFGEQRLSFQEPGGERKLLSSHRSLGDYGIFSKVTIRVLDTFPPQIQVFVKDASGQSTPYAIYPDDTILCLKGEIEGAGGPRVEDQVLKFQGRKLRDHHNFTSLEIKDSDTITLERKDLRAQPYNLF